MFSMSLLSCAHCHLEDVTITFTDKNEPKDPNRWEYYWWQTLKTTIPLDLNVEDDWVVSIF